MIIFGVVFNCKRNMNDMQEKKSMKGGKHAEEIREAKKVKGKIWKEGNTFPPILTLQWQNKTKATVPLGLINYDLYHEHKWGVEI
jgi:hypothetical protein